MIDSVCAVVPLTDINSDASAMAQSPQERERNPSLCLGAMAVSEIIGTAIFGLQLGDFSRLSVYALFGVRSMRSDRFLHHSLFRRSGAAYLRSGRPH